LAWLYSSFKTNIDEGISLAKRAIELNPNVAAYHDTLGELYYQKGLYSKAIGEMRIALWLEPDNKDFKDRLKKIKNNYKEELNKNTKAKKSNIEPTILVLNGNGIRNSAKIMAKTLRKMGYNVCAIKNAKRFNYIRTIILYKKPFTKTAINIGHRLKGIQEIYRLKEKSEYDIWVIVGKK
jgi:tetratricopeptide (TPR) repeat protein